MELNPNLFTSATKLVIDNFEGGYYHPQMYRDGRLNPNTKSYNFMRNSGETMFGLDRHAGHSLYYSSPRKSSDVWTNLNYIPTYTYKNNDSKDFWTYLDNVNAKDNWEWNEKGGTGGEKLKILASKILFPQFEIYVRDNKWSDKAKQIVFSDAKLLFHFIYAIWNGPGFFAKWSKKLNTDVANNLSNAQILQNQLNLRSISASGTDLSAGKMAKLFNNENFSIDIKNLEKKSSFFLPIFLILGGLIYLTTKK